MTETQATGRRRPRGWLSAAVAGLLIGGLADWLSQPLNCGPRLHQVSDLDPGPFAAGYAGTDSWKNDGGLKWIEAESPHGLQPGELTHLDILTRQLPLAWTGFDAEVVRKDESYVGVQLPTVLDGMLSSEANAIVWTSVTGHSREMPLWEESQEYLIRSSSVSADCSTVVAVAMSSSARRTEVRFLDVDTRRESCRFDIENGPELNARNVHTLSADGSRFAIVFETYTSTPPIQIGVYDTQSGERLHLLKALIEEWGFGPYSADSLRFLNDGSAIELQTSSELSRNLGSERRCTYPILRTTPDAGALDSGSLYSAMPGPVTDDVVQIFETDDRVDPVTVRLAYVPDRDQVLVLCQFVQLPSAPKIPILRSVFDYFDLDQPVPESLGTSLSVFDVRTRTLTEVRRITGGAAISGVAVRGELIGFVASEREPLRQYPLPVDVEPEGPGIEVWQVPLSPRPWLPILIGAVLGVSTMLLLLRRRKGKPASADGGTA